MLAYKVCCTNSFHMNLIVGFPLHARPMQFDIGMEIALHCMLNALCNCSPLLTTLISIIVISCFTYVTSAAVACHLQWDGLLAAPYPVVLHRHLWPPPHNEA